jgi:hypothetical protein
MADAILKKLPYGAGMHGHCRCDRKYWAVIHRRCNYSAFNGYYWTPSDYSALRCGNCGHVWRTKANYVDSLPDERSK